MIKKILAVILLIPSICFAVPSITSVTGTLDDGQTGITIAGSGFGTNSNIPIDTWWGGPDGLIETGAVGSTVSPGANWYSIVSGGSATPPKYTTANKHSGAKSIHCDFYDAQYDCGFRHYIPNMTECYVTYWVRLVDNNAATTSFQWKTIRLANSSANLSCTASNHPTMLTNAWWNSGTVASRGGIITYASLGPYCTANYTTDDSADSKYWGSWLITPIKTSWYRFQVYVKRNSVADAADGIVNYELIGVYRGSTGELFNSTTVTTHSAADTGEYNYILPFFYVGSWAGTGTKDIDLYVDDMYINTTRARVEIANFSNWDNRFNTGSVSEIQEPTSWSATSIQFTVNHGSFVEDETAYVFVIDSDGVASDGEMITIGGTGGSDTTPATFPTSGPTGAQTCTSDPRNVTLECTTNENATVKYDTSDTTYDLMANTFSTTGEMSHSTVVSNACDAAYTYYVRSMDAAGNKNTSSTTISYTVSAETGDETNPSIEITTPATDPYDIQTQYITVSGTASDDVLLSTVTASCPLCQSVSNVIGTETWSVNLTLSQGTLGSDLLFGDGAFAATGNWSVGTYWSIAEGVATNTGTGSNSWLSYNAAVEVGETYRLYYDVTAYTSGRLVISQYGFGGSTVDLSNEIGSHTLDVTCTQVAVLGIVSANWIGSIDNVMLKKNQRNLLTMTATDSSANTNTDTVEIGYTPPSTTPAKVVGVGAKYISLGTKILTVD